MPHAEVTRVVEDYLALIWKSYEWPDSPGPSTTDLADALGVTPSTVSANLKKLARDGFIVYEPYGRIDLTEPGRAIAVDGVRRHRIIETYLVERLGLNWDEVHDEADRLEHAVSDLVLRRMDEALGHPAVDPHGDRIPRDGAVAAPSRIRPLAEAPAGARLRIARVSDRHPEVLRYLAESGLLPGVEIVVAAPLDATGMMTLLHDGREVPLGQATAAAVYVDAAR